MTEPSGTDVRETLETFGRHGTLAGILTRPVDDDATRTPVILNGAGIIHKVGPSRASVEIARHLASAGHPVLRFDLSGIGDSARVDEPNLQETVVRDIRDSISLVEDRTDTSDGVALVGFCSGADNALYVASDDPRVTRVVLFDPTVHRTRGFSRRRMARRLTSARSWMNVLSGAGIAEKLRHLVGAGEAERPPGYYGLLAQDARETDRRVATLVARDVPLLYVLSRGVHDYCNDPAQVEESLPTGYSADLITVVWATGMDHILSTVEQRRGLADAILEHMARDRDGAGA